MKDAVTTVKLLKRGLYRGVYRGTAIGVIKGIPGVSGYSSHQVRVVDNCSHGDFITL